MFRFIKSTKNKKVEVVNLEQMSPEEVKKHIFGAIMLNTDCCFEEKISYERMWQIIKSLVEEK